MKMEILDRDIFGDVEVDVYRRWWEFWRPKVVGTRTKTIIRFSKGDNVFNLEGSTVSEAYVAVQNLLRTPTESYFEGSDKLVHAMRGLTLRAWLVDPSRPKSEWLSTFFDHSVKDHQVSVSANGLQFSGKLLEDGSFRIRSETHLEITIPNAKIYKGINVYLIEDNNYGESLEDEGEINYYSNGSILKKNNRRLELVVKENGDGYILALKRLHKKDVNDAVFTDTTVHKNRLSVVSLGISEEALLDLRDLIDAELSRK